jgi:glycosyltransferase involved in cell wall biosynthesis
MKVAVVTPTIGTKYLKQNLDSVSKQTYKNIKSVVVCDGPEYETKVRDIIKDFNVTPMFLPENTGAGNYNGHRIYATIPYLIDADYFIFLDEDNWLDEEHVESLVKTVEGNDWAFTFRKIVDGDGKYICNDDCESLGLWPSCLSDQEYFVDVNCYFLPKMMAVHTSPIWYRRTRLDQPEVDRLLISVLRQNKTRYKSTKQYTLNYRVGNRSDSVKADFFINGNKFMEQKYKGQLPWKTEDDGLVLTLNTNDNL